jgi:hypothetical protein
MVQMVHQVLLVQVDNQSVVHQVLVVDHLQTNQTT